MTKYLTPAERKAIGIRIATLREMLGMTQSALAAKVYVTQPAISQWESGAVVPRRAMQFDLADVLRTTRSRLFREVAEAEDAAA